MDPGSLVILIGLPAMYLVFMGSMFPSIIPSFDIGAQSFDYVSYLAPGIIAFQTVMAGTMGGSMLWVDRRFGMFSQILSGPFTRTQYLLGIMVATTSASLIGALVMFAIAVPLGSAMSFTLLGVGLVLMNLIVGGVFFCSLLLFIAARVRSNNAYNSIQILVIFIINFVSDVFYPITSATPLPLRIFSYVNPLTYIADGIRAGLVPPSQAFSLWHPVEGVVLIAETVLMFALAYITYNNVRTSKA